MVKEPAPAEEAPSSESLPLKPAGKHPQAATPSQNSAISNDQAPLGVNTAQEPPEARHEETVLETRSWERDALDDMIDEAKALKDLVRDSNRSR